MHLRALRFTSVGLCVLLSITAGTSPSLANPYLEESAWAQWVAPAGDHYLAFLVVIQRSSVGPGVTRTIAYVQSGPCSVTANGALSCRANERHRWLPDDAFELDVIAGTASVRFRMRGHLNHVTWSDPELAGAVYTNECESGDMDGGGLERASRASGKLLGHRVSTRSKYDWASIFAGGSPDRCTGGDAFATFDWFGGD
jgi:hypothetical protein